MDNSKPLVRQAAVLVGLVERPGGDHLILTRRSLALPDHAGQICFPGGVVEPKDSHHTAAALREAQEEVGLDPHLVQVTHQLPRYLTGTGFEVTPVVGRIDPAALLLPCLAEVIEIFEIPVAAVLQRAAYRPFRYPYRGRKRLLWALPYGPYYIWGATAAILVRFRQQMQRQSGKYIGPQDSLAMPSASSVSIRDSS